MIAWVTRRSVHTILCLTTVLLLSSTVQAEPAPHAQVYAIKVGHMVVMPKGGLNIDFTTVIADSRCPTGVTCIWEGDAEVSLTVRRGNMAPAELRLHTSSRFAQKATYGGYEIALLSLKPAPRATAHLDPNAYVATLSMTPMSR